jgi:Domain of unknown function (DUF1905)
MPKEQYTFSAKMWRYSSDAASWFFVWVPDDMSAEIKALVKAKKIMTKGFASVPVEVTVGACVWTTTLFPNKDKPYLLSINKKTRGTEGLFEGDTVDVCFSLF